jgi:hypothetical protein
VADERQPVRTAPSGPAAEPDVVALTGWFSFLHGEATAGDLLALETVRAALDAQGLAHETFWSPGFRPAGPSLEDLRAPARHRRMVFVCGPLHGPQVAGLHRLFAHSVRIAVGVSVIDAHDQAVLGFDRIIARDAPGARPVPDLAVAAPRAPQPPVIGLALTTGQGEYGERRRHDDVVSAVRRRLAAKDVALVPLETRLSTTQWDLPSTAPQFEAVLRRMDLVVTNRLHGLVLALRCGVPALAIDPVAGGAKVSAQGRACGWPAVLGPEEADTDAFERWLTWCLEQGRDMARERQLSLASAGLGAATSELTDALLAADER